MSKEQRIIYFSGHVQGVGFRYTAIRAAQGFDVTGYVENLSDGRVECVVEGESNQIDAFLADLDAEMGSYIHNRTVQVAPCTGRFNHFGVQF